MSAPLPLPPLPHGVPGIPPIGTEVFGVRRAAEPHVFEASVVRGTLARVKAEWTDSDGPINLELMVRTGYGSAVRLVPVDRICASEDLLTLGEIVTNLISERTPKGGARP